MYDALPSRRWCREVLTLRRAAADLVDRGLALTDPAILRLSRRLDRLMLDATPLPGAPRSVSGPAG